MSGRRSNLPFVLKIISLFCIVLIVNVRNKVNSESQLAAKFEVKEIHAVNDYKTTAHNFVKVSLAKGMEIGLELQEEK
ncbi:hypothetical protein BH23BAC1_BH23BAC1_00300 [soil metagenome]